jgi:hypothetical protein
MKHSTNGQFLAFSLTLVLCLLKISAGYAEERGRYWDVSAGAGLDMDGIGSRQILFAPAFSVMIPNRRLLWLRLEGDLELIESRRKITAVVGAAPFIRFYMLEKKPRPFVELGAGPNIVTRNHVGPKNVGGFFLFSLMGGAGVEFNAHGRPVSISYRVRHLSNGHIFLINESVNTQYLLLSIGL